jgi:hypothetical protein
MPQHAALSTHAIDDRAAPRDQGLEIQMSKYQIHTGTYWVAALDGDIAGADKRKTKSEAEKDAAWLRRHPATRDRQLFGHGGDVRVVLVEESEWLEDEWVKL